MLPKAQYYNLTSTNEKVWPNIQQKALHIRQISNKKYGVIDKCTTKSTVVQTNVRQKVRFYRQNTLDQMYGVIDKIHSTKCTVLQTNIRPNVQPMWKYMRGSLFLIQQNTNSSVLLCLPSTIPHMIPVVQQAKAAFDKLIPRNIDRLTI